MNEAVGHGGRRERIGETGAAKPQRNRETEELATDGHRWPPMNPDPDGAPWAGRTDPAGRPVLSGTREPRKRIGNVGRCFSPPARYWNDPLRGMRQRSCGKREGGAEEWNHRWTPMNADGGSGVL